MNAPKSPVLGEWAHPDSGRGKHENAVTNEAKPSPQPPPVCRQSPQSSTHEMASNVPPSDSKTPENQAGSPAQCPDNFPSFRQAQHVYEQLSRASDLLWVHLIEDGTEKRLPAQRKPMVEEALQIYRQLDYPWGESDALVALSEINLALQDYSQAIANGEAALEMVRTLRDSRSQESLVRTLVEAYLAVGRDSQAQVIQRDYEQFSARQRSSHRARPRFSYGFAMGASYEMLPVLHQERRCFEER